MDKRNHYIIIIIHTPFPPSPLLTNITFTLKDSTKLACRPTCMIKNILLIKLNYHVHVELPRAVNLPKYFTNREKNSFQQLYPLMDDTYTDRKAVNRSYMLLCTGLEVNNATKETSCYRSSIIVLYF